MKCYWGQSWRSWGASGTEWRTAFYFGMAKEPLEYQIIRSGGAEGSKRDFFLTGSHCIPLAGLELLMYTRLGLNSQRLASVSSVLRLAACAAVPGSRGDFYAMDGAVTE